MIHIFVFDKKLRKVSYEKFKLSSYKNAKLWIELSVPTHSELEWVKKTFNAHPLVIEDMSKKATRPKIEVFKDHDFIVLYGIYFDEKIKSVEIDFLLGKNYVLSNHNKKIENFDELIVDLPRVEHLLSKGPDFMLHHLIDMEIDNYMPILSDMDMQIEHLENSVVENPTTHLLRKLFEIKRQLIKIRKVGNQINIFSF